MTCNSRCVLLVAMCVPLVEVSPLCSFLRLVLSASASLGFVGQPAIAQSADAKSKLPADAESADEIVVTAARTVLPANALPLTIDVINKDDLDQQVSISGSVTDAVATLTPRSLPPGKSSQAQARRCAGARRSLQSTASRSRRRCATAAATVSQLMPSSSTGSS